MANRTLRMSAEEVGAGGERVSIPNRRCDHAYICVDTHGWRIIYPEAVKW